jgi:hypothetical protein
MGRRLLILTGVLALVVGSSAAGAQGDGQGADNLVAGTATLDCTMIMGATCTGVMVHVNAQSGAGGVDPRGHFWIRYPNGGAEFGGAVVCMHVVVNSAALIGRIDQVMVPSTNPMQGFTMNNFVQIRITDNGSPGTADLVNFDPGTPGNPGTCGGVGDIPISQGNYVVHDQPVVDLSALDLLLAQFEAAANDPYG